MHKTRHYRGTMGLILFPVAFGVSFQKTSRQVSREHDVLAHTRKRIVDSVEPLCREALPHDAKLLFLATPVVSTSVRSRKRGIWTVDCLNEGGEQRLHLLWNAETNRLVALHQINIRRTFRAHPILSKAQALHESVAWLERLAIMPHEETQRCAYTVETQRNACDIHFRLKAQSVSVGINTYSDELLFVYVNNPTPGQ